MMKKSNKLIALILTLVMMMSMGTVTTAATMSAAQQATKLGLIQGDENGVTEAYLMKEPTRLQAAIISLRLQGLEDEALAYTGTLSFSDASEVSWTGGRNILAYLKGTPSAGWSGYPDGSFLPNDPLSAQAYVKVMLEALGYKQGTDFEWNEVFEFAKKKGLSELSAETKMTNEQLAIGTIDAVEGLSANGYMFLDDLIKSKKIDFDDAVAAGLKEALPTTVEVVSVKGDSLKQITVTFNVAIEDAGDEGDYTIVEDNGSDAVIDEDSDFALSEDGKVVTITLTEAADQQDFIDLEIDNIVEKEQLFEDVQFLDLTIPSVASAEVVGVDTIKVYFSESMDVSTLEDKGNYEVTDKDDDQLYIRSVAAGANEMSALIELYSDIEDIANVEVSGVEDYLGFAVLSKTFTVEIPDDNDAPVVVGYKDTSTRKVTLIFDGDIEIEDSSLDNYYHTNSSNEASSISLDDNELTIKFAEGSEMPEGTVYIYIEDGALNDLWDNENDKIVETIKVVVDKTPAKIVGDIDVINQSTIEITFDKDIVLGDDFELTLLKSGDEADESADGTIKSSSESDVLLVEFSEPITGKYSLMIEGVEDENGNETPKDTMSFFMDDETAPVGSDFSAKLYNAGQSTQMVKVSFNGEEMNVNTITDREIYFAEGVSLDDSDVDFDVVDDGKAVEIEIPESVVDLEDGDKIVIGRVKDAAGNSMTTLSVELTLNGSGEVEIEEVRLVEADMIEVQIKDDLLVAYDADEFEFSGLGEDRFGDDIVVSKVKSIISDDETVLQFTLSEDMLSTDASGLTYSINSGAGENEYGESLSDETGSVIDQAAPSVAYEGIELSTVGTKITITFTEDLDEDLFAPSGLNGFSVSGGDAELDTVAVSGNMVVLKGTDFTSDTNVYYNDAFGLADEEGNELDDFAYTKELE